MIVLQNFIYPTSPAFGSKEKYLRVQGAVHFAGQILEMTKFSSVEFSTFYNALSALLWRDRVGVNQFRLQITGQGKVELELWHYSSKMTSDYLETVSLDLTEQPQGCFELEISDIFKYSGLIYPKLTALEDEVKITSLAWLTDQEPRREVKLGLSITHFNRKQYVLPAIQRIKNQLLEQADWRDKLSLIVVDNSQTITAAEAQGMTIIPNENTGGTGGFMRGFLHYKYQTEMSHVLFMDDDASLEIESIKRAYRILQFAKDDKSCVGASLFYENKPNLFIERGARLDKNITWFSKYTGTNACNIKNLIKQENDQERSVYAAWWFCAFPIKAITRLSPPFCVRGDDVSFGPLNDLNVISANGIACIGDDFAYKMSPVTEYLDLRNNLIVHSLLINKAFYATKHYAVQVLRFIFSARYGYVEAQRQALKDYLRFSPSWAADHAKMSQLIPEINEIAAENIPLRVDLDSLELYRTPQTDESLLSQLIRVLTVNRAFLPLRKDKLAFQELVFLPQYVQFAGFEKILFYNPQNKTGFVAQVSRKRALKYIFLLMADSLKLFFSYRIVSARLRKQLGELSDEKIWREILTK